LVAQHVPPLIEEVRRIETARGGQWYAMSAYPACYYDRLRALVLRREGSGRVAGVNSGPDGRQR
jgi:hypothetical protein